MTEYYVGIDVGYDKRRNSTGLCLLTMAGTRLNWTCCNTGTEDTVRRRDLKKLIARDIHISGVGIDGPIVPDLKRINRYRAADSLLYRGRFHSRCKPGSTKLKEGQCLHHHASSLAELVIDLHNKEYLALAESRHSNPVHQYCIVETFPNAFLAFLLGEVDFPTFKIERGEKSDVYWNIAVRKGYLKKLIEHLIPRCCFDNQRLEVITDHDHRAAFVCALAAMCVAKNKYVAAGDDIDGDFIMPPCEVWGFNATSQSPWAETALRENVVTVRRNQEQRTNHDKARVIRDGCNWL